MKFRSMGLLALGVLAACQGGRELSGSRSGSVDEVTIYRTEHAIPNIEAADAFGLGYGVGFAQAEDNFCLLAAMWTNLAGEGARFSGRYLGPSRVNVNLFNRYINQTAGIEQILELPPPHGPLPEVLDLLDGYVEGYNLYLAQHGVEGLPDPDCRGGAHIRPISRIDVARRLYELIGKGGRDLVWSGMIAATPPSLTSTPHLPNQVPLFGRVPVYSDLADAINDTLDEWLGEGARLDGAQMLALGEAFKDHVESGGSNAVGLGAEATDNGSGLLLGNPHWGWDGFDRFW